MNEPKKLLSVAEAKAGVLGGARAVLPIEIVPIAKSHGRTLARDLTALRTQPPLAVSAMDGYALRSADVVHLPATLHLIGESAAGHGFAGTLGQNETVRIFTGAPVPDGADAILVQEMAIVDGNNIQPQETVAPNRHIRSAGIDFTKGAVLLKAGTRIGPSEVALAAAMNHGEIAVIRRPKVAILATGDELVLPGGNPGPDQIVASNSFAIAVLVEQAGGEVLDLGIAGDSFSALETAIKRAKSEAADILVTIGGASVGDHDLVKTALANEGMQLGFWRIAMRPGKPLIHGRLNDMSILGFPGNPVSAIVCAHLFLVPLLRALQGDPTAADDTSEPAILGVDLKANDMRQDYLRATLTPSNDSLPVATPFALQDSSLLRILAESQCLLIRAPFAPAAQTGDPCRIIRLNR